MRGGSCQAVEEGRSPPKTTATAATTATTATTATAATTAAMFDNSGEIRRQTKGQRSLKTLQRCCKKQEKWRLEIELHLSVIIFD